jgi:UDP-N-acetylmuramoyl-tripeptide--D-alanyl-D-alanine ligase
VTPLWRAGEAAAAAGGQARGDWAATGVSIDSRTLQPGDLFVALTDQRDGHDFVAAALARGAAAAMVSRLPEGVAPDAPLLRVPDVLEGLRGLARAARARSRARVAGVTGSVGKTGTKEMLRTALAAEGRVHAAEKSFNNHWGVPLTLARLPADADFAVIEMGMNAPGEIAPLSLLARPHAAIVTAVAPVHLAAFRDLRGIAREKAAILDGVEPGGAAVINRDAKYWDVLERRARARGLRLVRYGWAGRPEFALDQVRVTPWGTVIRARIGRRFQAFKLAAPGRHLAANALGVLAVADALGVDVPRAALALAGWQPPEGRGARWDILLGPEGMDGTIHLIDESYNANPAAMEAALEVFAAIAPENGIGRVARGRRVAFLADMLELGPTSAALHEGLAALPALAAVDVVHCAGPLMRALHAALPAGQRGEWHETSAGLAGRVRRLVDAGDVVMAKGSNGARVGLIVEAVKRLGVARPALPPGQD